MSNESQEQSNKGYFTYRTELCMRERVKHLFLLNI